MDFLRPRTWAEALDLKAARPEATPIQGGTDVMVEINLDKGRPAALLDLTPIPELTEWSREGDVIRLGAGVTYSRLIGELGARLPGLAQASRTVGSPQIRNRGTVAGNLGAASPAGDSHPPLLACDAVVEAESVRGARLIPIGEFYTGVKRNALAPDELIRAVRVPVARGPQYFSKIGTRNAMVIAVCSFSIALHAAERRVGTGVGSAAPTPRRAVAAEEFAAARLDWQGRSPLDPDVAGRFGELVAGAAAPIDDVRGRAAYRTHALAVLARRALGWAWADFRAGTDADSSADSSAGSGAGDDRGSA
ncbi:xanthine dehydrogenase family protein subunit M [Microbispora cellulosiformans]|uniref:Xanthine dehydrogenase family protein subunit M n=1 Tax=Microbispora cellulosiformans TaxID=2614688 RepID=A0A5J5K8Q2_9ACTN|nr:FAD binding domain-containing protein [Microbispora cellulosiformans]KAA9379829.1 xanthine dehydrogenase family protein subunit M [Microbispora cellulosiformans]